MYSIEITKKAFKELYKIPTESQDRIIQAIYALSENPFPPGHKKLTGRNAWRIRIGSYRIIYEVEENELIVLVVLVGHRREIYRK